MKKNIIEKFIVVAILVSIGIAYRIFDFPPNFSPIMAISMFGAYYYKNYWFFLLPLTIMLVSDFYIGFYEWRIMLSVYGSIALISFFGLKVKRKYSTLNIVQWSLLSSLLFFVVSNFSVWLFGSWYPHNIYGLGECFYLAIPFFRNTMLGDLFFNGAFFGAYALLLSPSFSRRGLVVIKNILKA